MYPYIIVFCISFVFLIKANKNYNDKRNEVIYEILAICSLSFLAAIRDVSIGTDVELYVKPVFEMSKIYGFIGINDIWYVPEIGYKIFNCLVAMITSKFSIYLFFQQIFILMFALIGIKKMYKKEYAFAYIIYIILFYNRTFNIVRQSMALSISIFAISYLIQNKNIKFLILWLFAMLFHDSAIILGLIFIIYKIYIKNICNALLLSIIIFAIGIIIITLFQKVMFLFNSIGLLTSNYLFYLDNYVNTSLDFNFLDIGIDVIFIVFYLFFNNVYRKKDKISGLYYIFLVMDLCFLILSSKYAIAYRMGMYFRIPALVYFFSNFEFIFKDKDGKKNTLKFFSILLALIIWYHVYAFAKDGQTIPFEVSTETYFYKIFLKLRR